MRKEPVNSTFFLYNTVCSITIYDADNDADKDVEAILAGAKEIAFKIRRMLDFYDPESELGSLNWKHETGVPCEVSRELCSFISELLHFTEVSEGCFDPTVGPVVKLWNITARSPKVPSGQAIEAAREKTGAEHVLCDLDRSTVTFQREGMVLDAGGAGKGYAAGCVAEYLKAERVRSASINFGGNLFLIGRKMIPDGTGRPWRIAIQAPWKSDLKSIGALTLKDCGTATSGGYDRYFAEDERIYHHLLDPRTGYPADNSLESVTVVSQNALYTDLLSTACFVGGEEVAERICRNAGCSAGYVLLRKDGRVIVSDHLKPYFEENKI